MPPVACPPAPLAACPPAADEPAVPPCPAPLAPLVPPVALPSLLSSPKAASVIDEPRISVPRGARRRPRPRHAGVRGEELFGSSGETRADENSEKVFMAGLSASIAPSSPNCQNSDESSRRVDGRGADRPAPGDPASPCRALLSSDQKLYSAPTCAIPNAGKVTSTASSLTLFAGNPRPTQAPSRIGLRFTCAPRPR